MEECKDGDPAEEGDRPSQWSLLPDLLLEQIFSYLNMGEKYAASQVCRSWYRAFNLPRVWHTFRYDDITLTRRKYNYYYGWQSFLDHMRTQNCLASIGRHIRHFILRPAASFFNLYEFMNMLSYFAERQPPANLGIGPNIHSLSFVFPCNMAVRETPDEEGTQIFGTGGRLLDTLKRLMGNLPSLQHLELVDLNLEPWEARHLLDEVCSLCSLIMTHLVLVNATRVHCPLLHVGVFLNLQVLVISPQSLGEDVLELLSQTQLRHLHLLQNCYSPSDAVLKAVCASAWQACRRANPHMAVHLQGDGIKGCELLWQRRAPVRSILYDSPHSKVVRDRISTSTVLLLAQTGRNLSVFAVRRNAVILRCDWPHNPEWSSDFAHWLRAASRSYLSTEQEVSQLLGRAWNMLSDQQFKKLVVNLYDAPY